MLRIRIRDPVPDPFVRDPGWAKNQDPWMDGQPGSYFGELRNHFWVKILKFFDADPGWEKIGSGIRDGQKFGSGIRDKRTGSAKLKLK